MITSEMLVAIFKHMVKSDTGINCKCGIQMHNPIRYDYMVSDTIFELCIYSYFKGVNSVNGLSNPERLRTIELKSNQNYGIDKSKYIIDRNGIRNREVFNIDEETYIELSNLILNKISKYETECENLRIKSITDLYQTTIDKKIKNIIEE